MVAKFGKIKIANASYSIIGESESNVVLTITINGIDRNIMYSNISIKSAFTKIKQLLHLPNDYII